MAVRLSEALKDVGRPVAYFPQLAKFLGGVKPAILLGQAFYWSERTDESGEFWKSQQDFADETGLTIEELRAARKILAEKRILQSRYARIEHRLYFRINRERLDALWLTRNGHVEKSQVACGQIQGRDAGKPDFVTSSKSTAENTNGERARTTVRSRSSRAIELPEGFQPDAESLALLEELGLDLEYELWNFIDGHREGERLRDWQARFRRWIRKSEGFNKINGRPRKATHEESPSKAMAEHGCTHPGCKGLRSCRLGAAGTDL